MKTYPLKSLTIDQAMALQFKLINCVTNHFDGYEILTRGDLGVSSPDNMPQTTRKIERVIADFFNQEEAIFVRGAGTAAIFQALASVFKSGDTILLHEAEIYQTTKISLKQLNLNIIQCNFNDLQAVKMVLEHDPTIKGVLIQYSRQSLNDHYDIEQLISTIRSVTACPIITDDNYVAMKVEKTGVQCGANLSCFSCFKLLGPQGVGLVIGDKHYIAQIRQFHYSGGSQIQGFEALESLFGLVYAPVALAIQATQIEQIATKLNQGVLSAVKQAVIANAQSKVVLVEFKQPIAKQVLVEAVKLGAAAHPVGAESRFELVPMFYRLSKTMRDVDAKFESYWIRINPMRAGADTVITILAKAVERVLACY